MTTDGDLDAGFCEALAELDEYLDGMPHEHVGALVLPFATRWVLPDAGFDLVRLRDEARTLVGATPLSDRILTGFADQVAWFVAQRMLLDESEQSDLDAARVRVDGVRALIGERAEAVDAAGFARVGDAFRRALDESAAGEPPADALWQALALRIAESVL